MPRRTRSPHGDVERFDRWAGTYDRSFLQARVFDPVHRAIVEALGPLGDRRVLDAGCGTGILTGTLAGAAGLAVGVDPAPRMVAEAARKPRGGRSVTYAVAASQALPFAAATFDAATASMTLHHWADAGRGLAELARVIRPGGRLVIADIDMPGLVRQGLRRLRNPHAGWSRRELADVLYGAGFARVRARNGPLGPRLPIIVAER